MIYNNFTTIALKKAINLTKHEIIINSKNSQCADAGLLHGDSPIFLMCQRNRVLFRNRNAMLRGGGGLPEIVYSTYRC